MNDPQLLAAMILHRIRMWTYARRHPLDNFNADNAATVIRDAELVITQAQIDRLVDAIARGAFVPLGITFGGRHFDATWRGNAEDTARILPGDRVSFSAKFLKSIGTYAEGAPRMHGTVLSLSHVCGRKGRTIACAEVDWGSGMECPCTCWPISRSACTLCYSTNRRYYQVLTRNLIVSKKSASPDEGEEPDQL